YPKPIRTELRDDLGRLRVQLGPEVGDLAADVRAGLLRDRDDRLFHIALRYRALRRRSLPAQPAPVRSDDCRRHRDAQDGPGPQADLGPDAGSEVVHLD